MPRKPDPKTLAAIATFTSGVMLGGSAFAMTALPQGYLLGASTAQASEKVTDAKDKTTPPPAAPAKQKAGQDDAGKKPATEAGRKDKQADAKKADHAEGKCGEGKCGGNM